MPGNRDRAFPVLWRPAVPLLLCATLPLGGCGGEEAGGPSALGAEQAADARANLEWTDGREVTEAAENLVFRPLELPPADYSAATEEVEPNDNLDMATPLGADLMARGTFDSRESDYYTLTSEGEAQIWAVEVRGGGLDYLDYRDFSGSRSVRRQAEEGRAEIPNLYLPPGRHILHVRGDSGTYTLRAVPLGPPDPRAEREPNGDESRAHVLDLGRSRIGYLPQVDDNDYYRFSLRNPDHLRLLVEPPPGVSLQVDLRDGGGVVAGLRAPQPGDTLRYSMALPVGDYHLRIRPDGDTAARLPYRLRLEPLDPFDLPCDAEPNDAPEWAREIPASLVIQGEVGPWDDDDDWYRLPVQGEEARLILRPIRLPEGRELHQLVRLRDQDNNTVPLERNPDSTVSATVSPGTTTYLRISGTGAYGIVAEFEPGPDPRPAPGRGDVDLAFPAGPHVFAAFWPEAQHAELPLRLRNTGETARRVALDVISSDPAWRGKAPPDPVQVQPGETRTVPIALDVDPDAWGDRPVRLSVRGTDGEGGWRSATTELLAQCEASVVNPSPPTPLPLALLGGLNVAWSGFGATVASTDERRMEREEVLLDGYVPAGELWHAGADDLPWDLNIDLAGEEPIPVVGVVLNPGDPGNAWELTREFELWLSSDGESYTRSLTGYLTRHKIDQPFVLAEPTAARFARIHVLRAQGDDRRAYLASIAVVAEPGSTAMERDGVNIAAPEVGGHVVWSDPLLDDPRQPELLTEREEGEFVRLDELTPNDWVIGFHHQRAARIRRIEWVQPSGEDREYMVAAEVAVSTASPVGPWSPLGTLTVDSSPGAEGSLDLEDPVWARYVKLTVSGAANARWYFTPETVRIFEQPVDDRYRSILGEWGQYGRAASYERLATRPTAVPEDMDTEDDDERGGARPLDPGRPASGAVRVGEDVDWYRVEADGEDNRLRLELRGIPALRAALRVEDETGLDVPLTRLDEGDPGLQAVMEAEIAGERTYYVRVEEPPRSIALVWDNSASVTRFHETLYPSLLRFTSHVQPGREFIHLMPFAGPPRFLLPGWSDRPYELQAAVAGYDRGDSSSDAELNLKTAVDSLRYRQGTRAIVILTDANSPGYDESAWLWKGLSDVRPSIFAVELHAGNVAHQQDMLQSWAAVNAGEYHFFRTAADLDVAFQRASCMIRRPARYSLTASTRYDEPPLPGFVTVGSGVLELNAVELILDASGSMLQRMEGRRRIEIARDVLSDLVTTTIPEGTPLALRIFGHRTPDACDTDLEVPLQDLDSDHVRDVIQRTQAMNLAKTPIGASLRFVAEDLGGVTGQKLILLITDGEETCGGDPASEIRALKEAGHDVRVNIVGFAIDDEGLKNQFESWAREGGGLYFDAANPEELARAVERALRPKFQVVGAGGEVLGEGTAGLDALELPVGDYTVRILTSPVRSVPGVRVESGDTTRVEAGNGQQG